MSQTKDFSILKWLVFPSLTLALGAVIAYFNVRVFGIEDGAPYVVVVVVLTAFSIAINKYVSSENLALARSAFVLEIILILALAVNAAYSFSVQREMSVAGQNEKEWREAVDSVSKLRGQRNQKEALQQLKNDGYKIESRQEVFKQYERPLFWIMVAELLAYIISAFTLLGISHLWTPKPRRQPTDTNYIGERGYVYLPDGRKRVTESSYSDDEVGMIVDADHEFETPDQPIRPNLRQPRLSRIHQKNGRADLAMAPEKDTSVLVTKKDTAKTQASSNSDDVQRLRQALRHISFYTPNRSFKIDLKSTYLWIRQVRANQGTQETIHSVKMRLDVLDDALTMPADAFHSRLERFLKQNGFEI